MDRGWIGWVVGLVFNVGVKIVERVPFLGERFLRPSLERFGTHFHLGRTTVEVPHVIENLASREFGGEGKVPIIGSSSDNNNDVVSDAQNNLCVEVPEKDEECAICLLGFEPGQAILTTGCRHRFHALCVLPAWEKKNSCPICRSPIDTHQGAARISTPTSLPLMGDDESQASERASALLQRISDLSSVSSRPRISEGRRTHSILEEEEEEGLLLSPATSSHLLNRTPQNTSSGSREAPQNLNTSFGSRDDDNPSRGTAVVPTEQLVNNNTTVDSDRTAVVPTEQLVNNDNHSTEFLTSLDRVRERNSQLSHNSPFFEPPDSSDDVDDAIGREEIREEQYSLDRINPYTPEAWEQFTDEQRHMLQNACKSQLVDELFEYSSKGQYDAVDLVLRSGILSLSNCRDVCGNSILHYTRNLELVKLCVETYGADVNAQNDFMWTPLHWAAECENPALVHTLLGYGADPNLCTTDGNLPQDLTNSQSILDILARAGPQ